jgi:hypothetical protein
MPFYMEYPIAGLTPAPYNPRHLDDNAFMALQRSIKVLGMIKPVIIADNGTIVAGHQRARAAAAGRVRRGQPQHNGSRRWDCTSGYKAPPAFCPASRRTDLAPAANPLDL